MIAIRDLDFFEIFDQSKQVCGGLYTSINNSASTNQSVAFANAQSIAMGDKTLTWAHTTTNVTTAPYFTSSYARSDGIAIAQTGLDSSTSYDTTMSSSIYINFFPSSIF
jgi:hypothetical protein